MSDAKSPRDRLLEVVVFAPTGLAMTLVEEFPRLVEKGRHRVEGHVHTARLVGQFALQMGRRRMEQTVARMGQGDDRARPSAQGAGGASGPPAAPAGGAHAGTAPDGPAPGARAAAAAVSDDGAAAALAIPNYDSLSASQVVQRLDGLSQAELQEVRAHEAGHRHRRTILSRVEQLLAGDDGQP